MPGGIGRGSCTSVPVRPSRAPLAQILWLSGPVVYEPIPQADHGLDLRPGLAQLASKPAYVHVDGTRLDEPVVPPDPLEPPIARHDPGLVPDEIAQPPH